MLSPDATVRSRARMCAASIVILGAALSLTAPASASAAQLPAESRPATSVKIGHSARSLQPGEIVTLRVTTAAPVETLEAVAFGRTIPLWPRANRRTWTALVGLDVELAPGRYTVGLAGRTRDGRAIEGEHMLNVVAKRFTERRLRVDPRFSSPPPEMRERIVREAARLDSLFGATTTSLVPSVPFAAPVPQPTSSPFGARSFFNGEPRSRHNGIDFSSPDGTEIRAPAAGRVVLVDDLYFTGHTVVVDHGFGLYSLFAHMRETAAEEDADVTRGALLGWVGATGRATGPHLHWSVRLQGAKVDPTSLLAKPAR